MLSKDRVPGELLVKFYSEVPTQTALTVLSEVTDDNLTIKPLFQKSETHPNIPENFWVSVDEEYVFEILVLLNSNPAVESARPNYRYSIDANLLPCNQSASIAPRNVNSSATSSTYAYDSNSQWALDMIGMQSAWDKGFIGSSSIKIGVLDSGIDIDHPDLQDNIDHTLAYNAMTDQTGINYVNDDHGHGTIVSGIIAADINQAGISGICTDIALVPIKVYDGGSEYNDLHIQNAIVHAFNHGIYILNFSYTLDTETYASIGEYIELWNGIFVVSAGNGNVPMEEYSAGAGKLNDDPWWVVVGASNSSDTRWVSSSSSGSNYSAQYCDLFAPGADVYTTNNNGGYGSSYGTSLAAPHVAAAIALIKSHAQHYSYMEVKDLLLDTVDEVAAFENLCVTGGRLSIINAVNRLFSENRGAYTLGDLTGDGYVKSQDYMMAKRAVLGTYTLTNVQRHAADVNKNGSLDEQDYMMIQQFALKTHYFAPN